MQQCTAFGIHMDGVMWRCERAAYIKNPLSLCQAHNRQRRKGQMLREIRPMRSPRKVLRHDPNDMIGNGIPEGHQRCVECEVVKPLTDFNKNDTSPNGRTSICRACHGRYMQDRVHGIGTATWKKETFAKQGYRCGYCGSSDPRTSLGWITEHCHVTGRPRGVVCHNCNIALSYIEKHSWDVESFARAVRGLVEQGLVTPGILAPKGDPT